VPRVGRSRELTDANRRFDIRKSRRGISFVRAGREIETLDAFPRSQRDRSVGLGNWPLLQSFAYHWGIQVAFEPSLDEPLGIANDKQTVRPSEDFWRVLALEEIDRLAREENAWQAVERSRAVPVEASNEPTAAERSAAAADAAFGRATRVPDHAKPAARTALEETARQRASVTQESIDAALAALEQEATQRKYMIEFIDSEDGPFYTPRWLGTAVVVQINRLHPFFTILYGDLVKLNGGARARAAVEVSDTPEMREWYSTQRKDVWSPFLRRALNNLAQTIDDARGHEEEMQEDDKGEGNALAPP
jgi:hypothetical protein